MFDLYTELGGSFVGVIVALVVSGIFAMAAFFILWCAWSVYWWMCGDLHDRTGRRWISEEDEKDAPID
jgi:hypothetical protein